MPPTKLKPLSFGISEVQRRAREQKTTSGRQIEQASRRETGRELLPGRSLPALRPAAR